MALTREQSLSLAKARRRAAEEESKKETFSKRAKSLPGEYEQRYGGEGEAAPSISEVATKFGDVAKGTFRGMVSGVAGLPGEIANIPRYVESGVRGAVSAAQRTKRPSPTQAAVSAATRMLGIGEVSPEAMIPRIPAGVPEAERFFFGEPETEAEKVGRTIGEITAPVGTTIKGGAFATRKLIGEVPPVREKIARAFEKKGYVFDPAQLRGESRIKSAGPTAAAREKNSKLATREASRETGAETTDISPDFLEDRRKRLGAQYEKIFNRKFEIDTDAVRTLQGIADFESQVYPAGVGQIRSTVQNITSRWKEALTEAKLKQIQQRTKTVIQQQQRGGVSRWRKDWPTLVSPTDANAPAWLPNAQKKVNDLSERLGLSQAPQVYAGLPSRQGLYGMATGDGYIMIRSDLKEDGALATALHEFGHQADFQYFRNQPENVQRQLVSAWMDETSRIPFGTKTLEQMRPLTSQKYGEARFRTPTAEEDRGYFRNFAEWYAEQTSRWLTQTEKPTNVIEQYFKGAADNWKNVYASVAGYTPKTEEVERFFNAAWREPMTGGAGNTTIAQAIQPAMRAAPESPVLPLENIVAPISGKELQRLRSNLTDLARRETDGQKRYAISELITKIDQSIIAKSNPKVLPMLEDANRKYAATAALADGISQGWVVGGRVDPSRLGQYVAGEIPPIQYGSGTAKHPLYPLGYGARELGLIHPEIGRTLQGSEVAQAIMGGKLAVAKGLGARSQLARAAQRGVSRRELERLLEEERRRTGTRP